MNDLESFGLHRGWKRALVLAVAAAGRRAVGGLRATGLPLGRRPGLALCRQRCRRADNQLRTAQPAGISCRGWPPWRSATAGNTNG